MILCSHTWKKVSKIGSSHRFQGVTCSVTRIIVNFPKRFAKLWQNWVKQKICEHFRKIDQKLFKNFFLHTCKAWSYFWIFGAEWSYFWKFSHFWVHENWSKIFAIGPFPWKFCRVIGEIMLYKFTQKNFEKFFGKFFWSIFRKASFIFFFLKVRAPIWVQFCNGDGWCPGRLPFRYLLAGKSFKGDILNYLAPETIYLWPETHIWPIQMPRLTSKISQISQNWWKMDIFDHFWLFFKSFCLFSRNYAFDTCRGIYIVRKVVIE